MVSDFFFSSTHGGKNNLYLQKKLLDLLVENDHYDRIEF